MALRVAPPRLTQVRAQRPARRCEHDTAAGNQRPRTNEVAVTATLVTPELALVDPQLRLEALRNLPPLEPYDFLRHRHLPGNPDLAKAASSAGSNTNPSAWQPPMLVAATVYALWAAARVTTINALFALGVMIVVLGVEVVVGA